MAENSEENAKEKPTTYKHIKVPLKNIVQAIHIPKIEDAVLRTNMIVIKGYQLARLWALKEVEETERKKKTKKGKKQKSKKGGKKKTKGKNKGTKDKGTKDKGAEDKGTKDEGTKTFSIGLEHFKTALRVIRSDAINSKSELLKEFQKLFGSVFKKKDKVDGSNLTQVLDYCAVEMFTAFKNNITKHFAKHLGRYVEARWKNSQKNSVSESEWTEIHRQLAPVKRDILNGTRESHPDYHRFIDECIGIIALPPKLQKQERWNHLFSNPGEYFPCLVKMASYLEEMQDDSNWSPMYQCFPQRNDCVPKSIKLDTKTLIYLLVPNAKSRTEYNSNLSIHQKGLWEEYFHIDSGVTGKCKHRVTGYSFDYSLHTDGMSASIQFIHQDHLTVQQEKKELLRRLRLAVKGIPKDETKLRKEKKEREKEKWKEETLKNKERTAVSVAMAGREEGVVSPSKSQGQKRARSVLETDKGKTEKNQKIDRLKYLTDLKEEELEKLKQECDKRSFIVIDPGKRDLFTAMKVDKKEPKQKPKIVRYSFRQYLRETKRLKYQRVIRNHKKEKRQEEEEKLSDLNGKTVDSIKFQKYIKEKTKINKKLLPLYADLKFRRYRWYSYLERRRAEDKMIHRVKKSFGNDVIVFYGDWSAKHQSKFFAPTPNKRIKRKFVENFDVYNLDEYKTSKLDWKTEEEGDNLVVKDKKGKLRKLHAVKTFTRNDRLECINRDRNACLNMRKLVLHYLEFREWKSAYKNPRKNNQSKPAGNNTSRDVNPSKRTKR